MIEIGEEYSGIFTLPRRGAGKYIRGMAWAGIQKR